MSDRYTKHRSAPEVGRRHDTGKGRNAREIVVGMGETLAVELHTAREFYKRSISAMMSDAWRTWRPDRYTDDDLPNELRQPNDYRTSVLLPDEDADTLAQADHSTQLGKAYLLRRAWVEQGRRLYPLSDGVPRVDPATLRRIHRNTLPSPDPTTPTTTEAPMGGIRHDGWIKRMALGAAKMIEPFAPEQVREVDGRRVISYGVSSYGYDVRCADEFKVFTNINSAIVDPKGFDPQSFVDVKGDSIIIPPNSFALARTVEYFRIPRNVLVLCVGKSTYARCGIIVNVTPLEPEWEGHVTLEFSNTTPLPARIYAGEGVAQFLFLEGPECQVSYKDRGGKYQGQRGVTLAKM